jgi:antitoxin ParD1/3/4
MANIERMTVVFPEPMAARIRQAVKAGEYATTSEAVRDAVRLWSNRRDLRERDFEALGQAFDEGKASGPAGKLDIAEIIAEARLEKAIGDRSSRG